MSPEVRGVGLMRPGRGGHRGGHRGGRRAFMYLEHAQPRFSFPDVLFEGSEGRPESGDVGSGSDKPVMVLPVLGVGELSGVCGRFSLRLLEAAFDVVEWDA